MSQLKWVYNIQVFFTSSGFDTFDALWNNSMTCESCMCVATMFMMTSIFVEVPSFSHSQYINITIIMYHPGESDCSRTQHYNDASFSWPSSSNFDLSSLEIGMQSKTELHDTGYKQVFYVLLVLVSLVPRLSVGKVFLLWTAWVWG